MYECLNFEGIENIPVVRDFPDVFLEELPGIPLIRNVEFVIDLKPGTTPIAKRPYKMPPDELLELKEEIDKAFRKGFIRPNSSAWGAPSLFVKKKDVLPAKTPTGERRRATRREPGSPWDGCGPGSSDNGPQVFWHRAHALVLASVPPDLYLIRKGGELPPIVSCMV